MENTHIIDFIPIELSIADLQSPVTFPSTPVIYYCIYPVSSA